MSRNILIPVDGSKNSQRAFDFYVDELRRDGDIVVLLHVQVPPMLPVFSVYEFSSLPADEWQRIIEGQVAKTREIMSHYEALCESKKISKKTMQQNGAPGEVICKVVKSSDASMIVMGSRGLNAVRRTFMGSVSDYVIHHCHLPVVVVPPE